MGNLVKTGLACVAVLAWVGVASAANTTTYRNSHGRTVGSSTTSGNKTTYRDAHGRTTGTATRSSSGTTTFRDSHGRTVGTSKRR